MAVKINMYDELPTGSVTAFGGLIEDLPKNWMFCDGSEISRNKWRKLFDIIGTTYGVGDNCKTFNLPNMRGRSIIGVNNSTFTNTLGTFNEGNISQRQINEGDNPTVLQPNAGSEWEENHQLTWDEMAIHTHTGTTSSDGQHTHTMSSYISGIYGDPNSTGGGYAIIPNQTTDQTQGNVDTWTNHQHYFKTDETGGVSLLNGVTGGTTKGLAVADPLTGGPAIDHNNMQPYIVCHWIIKG